MKTLLRELLRFHLRRPKSLWILLGLVTLVFSLGVLRVERRLDFMSLLPANNPVVRASIEAGVGQQELLWLVAEGGAEDLEARQAWAEHLVEKLLNMDGVPINGINTEGRICTPMPVPEARGVSLWPPLLAAGSFFELDAEVGRLVTEQFYAMAPMLLGDRLSPLKDPREVRDRFRETARLLGSPEPARANIAQRDPLCLRELLPASDDVVTRLKQNAQRFPLTMKTGYLETRDGVYVMVPLVLDFPSGDGAATARVLAWLGEGAHGALPAKASSARVKQALDPQAERPENRIPARSFTLQATGAHAIAYWESLRLGREVLFGLLLSFVLIGFVYWIGFRTLAGYGFVALPMLIGMCWALGLVGWSLGRLNLMAAAFGAVLLGIGDDVGILLFSRYRDERQGGRNKALALRAALLGTGPGVITGTTATAVAFLACTVAPFPGFRDLGFTAGLGLLACMAATFLILPALLLVFDKGQGTFARCESATPLPRPARTWKTLVVLVVVLLAALGAQRVTWLEDLRQFRQAGNPALALQEKLSRVLGAGLQPLAVQIPLDDPERLPQLWNRLAVPLRREGVPIPTWMESAPELRSVIGSETWLRRTLDIASEEGLDPMALERPLRALSASFRDPLALPLSLKALMPPPRSTPTALKSKRHFWDSPDQPQTATAPQVFTLPLRLSEPALERIQHEVEAMGCRFVGTRPLARAVRDVARESLREVMLVAFAAILLVVAVFGRRLRFLLYALAPLVLSQAGVLGILGWTGEPLTFLSLVAIPITMGVSVDVAMNLLHRARLDPQAVAKVARVNAVCAGTTLAGFGGLAFSAYRGLRGLGLAAIGGTAVALLVTQWLLPWLLEKWPLNKK